MGVGGATAVCLRDSSRCQIRGSTPQTYLHRQTQRLVFRFRLRSADSGSPTAAHKLTKLSRSCRDRTAPVRLGRSSPRHANAPLMSYTLLLGTSNETRLSRALRHAAVAILARFQRSRPSSLPRSLVVHAIPSRGSAKSRRAARSQKRRSLRHAAWGALKHLPGALQSTQA